MSLPVKALALSAGIAVASAFSLATPAAADGLPLRQPSRLYYLPPQNAPGDTSLYDIFRDGRYNSSAYLSAHPLSDAPTVPYWAPLYYQPPQPTYSPPYP